MQTPGLGIDYVSTPGGGRIGMCSCPGARRMALPEGDGVNAPVDRDLAAIRDWGAQGLVSLIEQPEFETLRVTTLPLRAPAAGLWWRHLPIPDMQPPGERFEARWRTVGPELRGVLRGGGSFVMHCWAGLGRTGTIAARLLVELGAEPAAAVTAVRSAREGAIQTDEQEAHVHALARGGPLG